REKMEHELSGTSAVTALPYTEQEKTKIRNEQFDVMKAIAAARSLAAKAEAEQKKLDKVKAVDAALDRQVATEAVSRYKAKAAKARQAVEAYSVKAGVAGTAVQKQADVGAVIYP